MQNIVSHRDVSRDIHEVSGTKFIFYDRGVSENPLITKIASFSFYVTLGYFKMLATINTQNVLFFAICSCFNDYSYTLQIKKRIAFTIN